ncbi:MAG: methyltransferase domain-containing protein [Luteitalea sp.]|nr:methyltransferase domain-containing protein [Luteitalea sp.]
MFDSLYAKRPLSAGCPDLERLGAEYHATHADTSHQFSRAALDCLERLIDLATGSRAALVVGCGPKPGAVRDLLDRGLDARAVEPVAQNVASARQFLQDDSLVQQGSAESLAFPDESFRIILMESVLEHVDSPIKALNEMYRVLVPGGVLYVYTTNRWKFSPRGVNGEYRVPFFNWFPAIVKESYVFQQLHYDPSLANFNARPAFHWFTYSELCQLGRMAGFAHFYSWIDLAGRQNAFVRASRLRRLMVERIRYRPWLRALALTQSGGSIFMYKRPSAGEP